MKSSKKLSEIDNPQIVKLKNNVVLDFPLVEVKSDFFDVKSGWKILAIKYHRPKGNQKEGKFEIELVNKKTNDLVVNIFEVKFNHSEQERLVDLHQPRSFRIKKKSLIEKNYKHFGPQDIEIKYSDIVIDQIVYNKNPFLNIDKDFINDDKNLQGYLMIKYHLGEDQTKTAHKVQIPIITNLSIDNKLASQFEKTQYVKVKFKQPTTFENQSQEVQKGLVIPLKKARNFVVAPEFVNSYPPIEINYQIISPKNDVKLRKVVYIPPTSVDEKLAYLEVEYYFEDQLHNERIEFKFKYSIRDQANKIIKNIKPYQIEYLPNQRLVPPTFMRASDFNYNGQIERLYIAGVEYLYDQIGDNDRFVDVGILMSYRTVEGIVKKRLEFKLSRREYINGKWRNARVENGSVDIDNKFYEPQVLRKVYNGDQSLQRDLKANAIVIPGYRYDTIKDITVGDFRDDSKYAMLKIVALEQFGQKEVEWNFQKWIKMSKSFNDWRLDNLREQDLVVNNQKLPKYMPKNLEYSFFNVNPRFKIFGLRYQNPTLDQKEIDVEIKIGTLTKTIFVKRSLTFQYSQQEYINQQKLLDANQSFDLKWVNPAFITFKVNLNDKPIAKIDKSMVLGIPNGIDYQVFYKPPLPGRRDTRVILKLSRNNHHIAYEQTIVFAKAQTSD